MFRSTLPVVLAAISGLAVTGVGVSAAAQQPEAKATSYVISLRGVSAALDRAAAECR